MKSTALTRSITAAAALLALLATQPAEARKKPSALTGAVDAIEAQHTFSVPATGSLEVAFSPNEGSEALVCKAIDSARREIRGLAYSFTSARVTEHLLAARHRGVDVRLVVDYKDNISEDRSGKARAALSALATAGADVRTISVYSIHHDKVVIVDGVTTELGSFNYSQAAAQKNSENVLVNWNNLQLAQVYLGHFARNYAQATPFVPGY